MREERNAKKENFDQRVTIKNSKVRFSNRLSDRNYEYNSALRTSNNEKKQMNNFATNTPKNSSKKNILRSPIHMRSNSIKGKIIPAINSFTLYRKLSFTYTVLYPCSVSKF